MASFRSRARSWTRQHPIVASWLIAGLFFWIARGFLALVGSVVGALFGLLIFLWTGASLIAVAIWVWRRLTYRIGVRLFISYLVIGVVPFLMMAVFAAAVGYVLAGQYASVRYGQLEDRLHWELGRLAEDATRVWERDGLDAALDFLRSAAVTPPSPLPSLDWALVEGGRSWTHSGARPSAPLPPRAAPDAFRGVVSIGSGVFFTAAERKTNAPTGEASHEAIAVAVPVDMATARALSEQLFFEVRFIRDEINDGNIEIKTSSDPGGPGINIDGDPVEPDELEASWVTLLASEGAWLDRLRVLWFRPGDPPIDWSQDQDFDNRRLIRLLKLQPKAVIEDLFGSRYEMQTTFVAAVVGLASFFLFVYLAVVGLAGLLIWNVTRSASRLSRGARSVGEGDLSYRIPVRQKDQLGDLALTFNSMTESIQNMVEGIAEKERLARELEVAREIQMSLLPPLRQEHGPLRVCAHFEPADEVGGDYLDLFPLDHQRLLVAAGDVAGHGLATSLLMAMVKSAVAILVTEGHSHTEVLVRLNELVRRQPGRSHMVTLALAEIDAPRRKLTISSAGHPPAFVLSPDGSVIEALCEALPLGPSWPSPPEPTVLPFPPGSSLVIYSDGLVEAADGNDEPLGYRRLQQELEAQQRLARVSGSLDSLDPDRLVSHLLATLQTHAGDSLDDDLTLVIVEHRPGAARPS